MNNSNYYLLQRLWRHILPKRRKQYFALFILMIIGSFAEIVSIGAIVPFLGALTAPDIVYNHQLAKPLIDFLEITSSEKILLPLTIIFGILAMFAGSIRLLLLWANVKLSFATGADLSIDVYRKTLYQPYEKHIQRNSSEVINTISKKINTIISNIIYPVISISSSILILLAILGALLIINPLTSLISIAGFGFIYLAVVLMTKKRTRDNGVIIAIRSTNLIKYLQEGLGGIRDVLLGGDQEKHCKNYNDSDLILRKAEGDNLFLSQSPRFFIEAIGIVMIASIAYYLSLQDGGIYKVMPILGALALGAQRMLPAFQQIYFGWSNIQSGLASLENVLELLDQPMPKLNDSDLERLNFKNEITLKNIDFSYLKNKQQILSNLNLTIKKGECIGVIGQTGSGKSTLLDLLMGLLNPTNGELLVDGTLISHKNIRAWQKNIAHIPQSIFLIDASVQKNIVFDYSDEKINKKKLEKATTKAKVAQFIRNKKDKLETIIGENGIKLSGGQRQRIGIARAIYKDSEIMIFDEATSALDSQTEAAIINSLELNKNNKTVIMVAHRLSSLKYCNKIIELKDGQITKIGSYNEVIRDNKKNENES